MIALLPFVPLAAAWAVLHRRSRRWDWGWIGDPRMMLMMRMTRKYTRTMVESYEILTKAIRDSVGDVERVTRMMEEMRAHL